MIIISWYEKQMLLLFRKADAKTRRRLHAMAMRMANHRRAKQRDVANDNDRRKPQKKDG